MTATVKLKPILRYEVCVQTAAGEQSLGLFNIAGEWEGMLKLQHADRGVMIVEKPDDGLRGLFKLLTQADPELKDAECQLHKASPSLFAALVAAKPETAR